MQFFKNRNKKKVQAPEPRQMSDIQAEYRTLCANAGELQHRINMFQGNLEQVLTQLGHLNAEANERSRLDAEAKAKEEPKTVTPEVASV